MSNVTCALSICLLAGAQSCGHGGSTRLRLNSRDVLLQVRERERHDPIIWLVCAWACGHATAGPLGRKPKLGLLATLVKFQFRISVLYYTVRVTSIVRKMHGCPRG
ncbi:hypothetical protein V8C35DRAFT_143619 [Trichoderma chlorosporum]